MVVDPREKDRRAAVSSTRVDPREPALVERVTARKRFWSKASGLASTLASTGVGVDEVGGTRGRGMRGIREVWKDETKLDSQYWGLESPSCWL